MEPARYKTFDFELDYYPPAPPGGHQAVRTDAYPSQSLLVSSLLTVLLLTSCTPDCTAVLLLYCLPWSSGQWSSGLGAPKRTVSPPCTPCSLSSWPPRNGSKNRLIFQRRPEKDFLTSRSGSERCRVQYRSRIEPKWTQSGCKKGVRHGV